MMKNNDFKNAWVSTTHQVLESVAFWRGLLFLLVNIFSVNYFKDWFTENTYQKFVNIIEYKGKRFE